MKNKILIILLFNVFVSKAQEIVPLYKGKAPGSENWNWKENVMVLPDDKVITNVTDPTLLVYEADKSIATGTAVIICPGGAFHLLSIENEGVKVAKWLNSKGVTAFVLKYRLAHLETDNPFQELTAKNPGSEKFNKDIEPLVQMDIADGKTAIAYVRKNASKYGLKSNQIGIMGFSAGGTLTTGVSFMYDAQSRPDFVAPIYPYVGSFGNPELPEDAPPMFIVAASDDEYGFQKHCVSLYTKWNDAKKPVELHIYTKGGHGFGMRKQNLPVDSWIDRFGEWLKLQGML
jgi:acetyl esterase/lipase